MLDEPMNVENEDIYVTDPGIAFSLPFPAVLRLPRGVNLILSFGFNLRDNDITGDPFKVKLKL